MCANCHIVWSDRDKIVPIELFPFRATVNTHRLGLYATVISTFHLEFAFPLQVRGCTHIIAWIISFVLDVHLADKMAGFVVTCISSVLSVHHPFIVVVVDVVLVVHSHLQVTGAVLMLCWCHLNGPILHLSYSSWMSLCVFVQSTKLPDYQVLRFIKLQHPLALHCGSSFHVCGPICPSCT